MRRACCFRKPGLSINRPKQDILFIEDQVYASGLREEFSIAANYASDPLRKDRGFAACNWLALSRQVPEASRNLARSNLYYLRPANELMGSFAARPVEFKTHDGYRPSAPSVASLGDEIVMLLPTVNLKPSENDGRAAADGEAIAVRNYLLRLRNDLSTGAGTEILPPVALPEATREVADSPGDLRLFAWRGGRGALPACRSRRPKTSANWCWSASTRVALHNLVSTTGGVVCRRASDPRELDAARRWRLTRIRQRLRAYPNNR